MSEQKPAHVVASVNTGMSVGGSKRPGGLRLQVKLLGLILIVFLLLAAVLGYAYTHSNSKSASTTAKSNVSTPPANISPEQKAQYYADKGQYQSAEQSWQGQLAGATDTATKVGIYYQQAAVAIRFKQYSDAKKYANDIKQLAPNAPDSYVVLAQLAQAQNNIPQAKQYWQQAINHVDPNATGATMIKSDYTNQMDALK